jgi:hypothetical protein
MPLRQLKLLLLLLLMLSHAVASCDSLVVHLPSDAHPLSMAVDSCHADAVAAYPSNHHQHADPTNPSTDESGEQASHSVHAHVSCFVPYQPMVAANKATSAGIVSVQTDLLSLTLAPPVPPPTLFC